MTQLFKVCILGLSTRVYPNVSWLEEYRKTVEVDGEQTWVGVILALEAELFAYPALRIAAASSDSSLCVISDAILRI